MMLKIRIACIVYQASGVPSGRKIKLFVFNTLWGVQAKTARMLSRFETLEFRVGNRTGMKRAFASQIIG
ncbi:MAG TPA: hypothetical protein VN727_05845, partial [Candidatus Binatia bacterium]|nr:hypothetical protein [Candidatus Binatia bacterium]